MHDHVEADAAPDARCWRPRTAIAGRRAGRAAAARAGEQVVERARRPAGRGSPTAARRPRRHRVRQEDRDPGEPARAGPGGVEQQREQQGQPEHRRHEHHGAVPEHPRPTLPRNSGSVERPAVVVEPGEDLGPGTPAQPEAGDLDPAQAQVDRVADRQRRRTATNRTIGRGEEGVRRRTAVPYASPAGRRTGVRPAAQGAAPVRASVISRS